MAIKDQEDSLEMLAELGLEKIHFDRFVECLKDAGYFNELDLLAMLVYMRGKQISPSQDTDKDKETKQIALAYSTYGLTKHEFETLSLMARFTYKQISKRLKFKVSHHAVAKRAKKIKKKMRVGSKEEAVAKAIREGIIL